MRRLLWTTCLLALAAACAPKSAGTSGTAVPLEDTAWTLVELTDHAGSTAAAGQRPTLTLVSAEDRAQGFAGCNRFFGPYTTEGAGLRFGALGATRMACQQDGAMQLEAAYLEALRQTTRYEITGAVLTLYAGDRTVARFRAEGGAAAP